MSVQLAGWLAILLLGSGTAADAEQRPRAAAVMTALARGGCVVAAKPHFVGRRAQALTLGSACDAPEERFASATIRAQEQVWPDGTVLGRARLAAAAGVALDIIAYASSGLAVGGLLCFPDDGARHSAVIHVPGGAGGVFAGVAGDMVATCINWAMRHGRTAFIPSLRGNDGGEGVPELCLGEGNDVVAAAVMLRGLEVTEAARLGLVGGSIGGCVVLRAAPFIRDLSAVVAYVPPLSWGDLIDYHRTRWQPRTAIDCNGASVDWSLGGPSFADALESIICGHAGCPESELLARSPLPFVDFQTAPVLIVSAEDDNIVPFEQQLLWSLFRQRTGHPVDVLVTDPCAPPGTPPLALDVHVVAARSFHLLPEGPVSTGLLFLMAHLDAVVPAQGPGGSTTAPPPVCRCSLH